MRSQKSEFRRLFGTSNGNNAMPTQKTSLPCLLLAQAQVAFNDNAAKLMLVGLAQFILPNDEAVWVISVLAALLVLPYVLFAPLVGWFADRYSKRDVLNIALAVQVTIMVMVIGALYAHLLWVAVAGFALLAIQACIVSPAKQGILKELVGSERLGMAVGWMEMSYISAVLVGSLAGGWAFDHWTRPSGDPWQGALWTAAILGVGSLVAFWIFQGVQKTDPQSNEPFHRNLFWRHFIQVTELWREKPLRLAALGNAYFYSFGGILYLTLVQFGRELHSGQAGSVTATGFLLLALGGGVAGGSLLAAGFCRRRIELGLVPIGGLGLSLALLPIGLSPENSWVSYAGLIALGIFAGLFTVPLNAFLQDRAGDVRRGRVIAAMNVMINLGGLLAVAIQYFLSQKLGLSAPQQFLMLIIPSAAVALYVIWLLPESLLRLLILVIARCVYQVRAFGTEHLPKGGALLICNHVSYVDALILQVACPRPIRFIAYEAFHRKWWLGWLLRIFGVIPISPHHAKDAIRSTAQRLKEGEWVCIFPEGQITRTGNLLGLRKGFELMARQAGVPVVPVYLDSLWGSVFSFSENRYFWKIPRKLPYPALVNFGKPISSDQVSAVLARQALLDLGEEAFQQRPELKGNLGHACFQALARQPWRELIVDIFPKRRVLSRGMALAVAVALSLRWRQSLKSQRIGVVLPPGIGGLAANLALVIGGKIPVNLNFTAGRSAIESCLRRGKIETVISADALRGRLADFPWPEHTLDIGKEIASCGKGAILRWLAAIWCLPSGVLTKRLGISKVGDRAEAGLLFTSGSSGEPKGVVLSHRNILGNVAQISATGILPREESLLACLPLFHSIGFTVTIWYPILEGVRLVTLPSPLEVKKISETIRDEKATVFIATPTFLRPYLRKVEPECLRSLKLIITGAEKLPADLAQSFQEKFGVPLCQGYGLTETSPVVSTNMTDPPMPPDRENVQMGSRPGSVGRLLPGMTARIVDPETGTEKSPLDVGMLNLRGPNVFSGYLEDAERTRQVFHDGWFVTGDLARFDEDGFLYIEGRLSRFSKIGGEMVPHGTVEQKIIEVLQFDGAEAQPLVIIGVPDKSKGEALVLLTTVDIQADALREKLGAAGLPNLWIPKILKKIEKVPVLASGKLDLKACEKLAKNS